MRLLYNSDDMDAASATASSELSSGLSGDNVLNERIDTPWRTTGCTDENLVLDLGSAVQITALGIFGGNWSADATIQLQANSADSWGSPAYSSTLTVLTDSDGVVQERLCWFGDQTYRYWRVRAQDAANTDGYLQFSRFMGGIYWEPTRNFNDGFRVRVVDPSEQIGENDGRQSYWKTRKRFRRALMTFSWEGRTDLEKWRTVFDRVGHVQPIMLAMDPDSYPTAETMYCTMTSDLEHVHRILDHYDGGQVEWQEIRE